MNPILTAAVFNSLGLRQGGSKMKKIVSLFGEESEVFQNLNDRAREYAASKGLEYSWSLQTPFNRDKAIEALKDADAGIIDIEPYDDSMFTAMGTKPSILVRFGVGYDKVDLAAASKHGLAIARTAGANTLGVAEMAMTFLLACRRMIRLNQKCVETGKWEKNVVPETIGSTVGIVGFGAIGQALAGLLSGLGCKIIAYDPFPNKAVMDAKNVRLVTLEELFETADAISIHVPYSKETHNFVDAKMLGRMKPSAVIVNTARGNLIDEEALYEALSKKKIAGAALDVYATEPLSTDSPLLKLDNIILTPHVSSQTYESLWRIYAMAIDIAADFFNGVESKHILNPDYKATARN